MVAEADRPLIMMADDDEEDRMLVEDALGDIGFRRPLECVGDGEELLDYLQHSGHAGERKLPGLILLDLNMPRKDGREALKEIKSDPRLRSVPVVVLTTSKAEEDVNFCYEYGVNSYMTKPSSYDELVSMLRQLVEYWFNTVQLPGGTDGSGRR